MAKRYYWLKLKEDFFTSPKIKKLRSVAGGDTYTLIYLELQLLSIKNEGKLIFEHLEDSLAEELALILDEREQDVSFLLTYLERYGLIEYLSEDEALLPEAASSFGSESAVASRVRKHRERKKLEALEGAKPITAQLTATRYTVTRL